MGDSDYICWYDLIYGDQINFAVLDAKLKT